MERALAVLPDDPGLLAHRGWCLTMLGREEEGIAELERAIAALPAHELKPWGEGDSLRMVPDGVPQGRWIAAQLKTLHAWLGLAHLRLGRLEQAREHYARSCSITPTHGRVDGLDGECVALLRLGRLDEAEARITEMLAQAPRRTDVARAYYHRACLRARQGRLDEAARDAALVIELQPRWLAQLATDEDLAPLREREGLPPVPTRPDAKWS